MNSKGKKNRLQDENTHFLHQAKNEDVGENDIYGITGIPSTVGRRGVVKRAGPGASTRIVYPGSGREDA